MLWHDAIAETEVGDSSRAAKITESVQSTEYIVHDA